MRPALRFPFATAVVVLVVVVALNLVLGNGILPGLVIGLVAAVLSVGAEWLLTRGREAPRNGG